MGSSHFAKHYNDYFKNCFLQKDFLVDLNKRVSFFALLLLNIVSKTYGMVLQTKFYALVTLFYSWFESQFLRPKNSVSYDSFKLSLENR